jgi:hypothetical protein
MITTKVVMVTLMKVRIEAERMIFITRVVILDIVGKAIVIISKVKGTWVVVRIAGVMATVTVMAAEAAMVMLMEEVQVVTATVVAGIIMEGIIMEEV